MGWYVKSEEETGEDFGKAQYLVEKYGGRVVSQSEAQKLVDTEGVVVVMDNGIFEAAGFAYDIDEFNAFTGPDDPRPRTFVVMDRNKVKDLTGYPR